MKSRVLYRSSSVLVLLCTCGTLESVSSFTDVCQQLFQLQDITVICTIHLHPWLHENHTTHQNLETLTETMQEHVLVEAIGKIVSMHVTKPEANILNICYYVLLCFSITVMTFKAYVTAVMNKLTYKCFVSQGRVRTAIRRGGQFCCSFFANLLQYRCTKNYQNTAQFDKVIAKIKGQFFTLWCIIVFMICI